MRTWKTIPHLCFDFLPHHIILPLASNMPLCITKPSPEWVLCSFVFLGSETKRWMRLFALQSLCPLSSLSVMLENGQIQVRTTNKGTPPHSGLRGPSGADGNCRPSPTEHMVITACGYDGQSGSRVRALIKITWPGVDNNGILGTEVCWQTTRG